MTSGLESIIEISKIVHWIWDNISKNQEFLRRIEIIKSGIRQRERENTDERSNYKGRERKRWLLEDQMNFEASGNLSLLLDFSKRINSIQRLHAYTR